VQDVSLFAQAVSGKRIVAQAARAPGDWVVGVPDAYPWGELTASAGQAMERATAALRQTGVRVVNCTLPSWAGDAFVAHDVVQGWEAVRALRREMETAADQLSPLLREYLSASTQISDEAYANAQATLARIRGESALWLPGIDVLLSPSAPDEPPTGYASTGASTFNRAWTLLGAPCVSVPGAVGVNGRPMGLQMIAPPGSDAVCLAAGAMLESVLK
jgi:Asp-tRNA(Asn)/Glu-tRNA(Gln) amidotransferase A subunit family amidase